MMRVTLRVLLAGALLSALGVLAPTRPAEAGWADANCNWDKTDWPYNSPHTKNEAYFHNYYLMDEGYHWGGGCANNNQIDDQPGDPTQSEWTHGEGTDCSGLVFRTWFLTKSWNSGWAWHNNYEYNHGPYTANSFRTSQAAWTNPPKSTVVWMDALASTSHVGIILSSNADGTDNIFEAKSEAMGTGFWTRNYRGQSAYVASRRIGWT